MKQIYYEDGNIAKEEYLSMSQMDVWGFRDITDETWITDIDMDSILLEYLSI